MVHTSRESTLLKGFAVRTIKHEMRQVNTESKCERQQQDFDEEQNNIYSNRGIILPTSTP